MLCLKLVWQIIVEGILEKGTKENGKDVEMLAPQTFGQESLIEEAHVNDIFVRCVQPTKMLEIKKAHFERYVRPLQLAEWERVATIVSELPIFNESDAVWEGNRLKRLLQSMQLKTYKAGDIILQEGVFQKHVIFLLSGHCHVTKHVQDEKFAKNAALLPSPLRSNTSMAMAQKSLNKQGARDVDIIVLYRGAVLDAEAPLEMRSASFTATAMSRVEVALIDTDASIFIDNPVSLI